MPARIRSAIAFAKSDLKNAYSTTPTRTIPPIMPTSGISSRITVSRSTPGGGGVCAITGPWNSMRPPTPLADCPFQQATSWPRLPKLPCRLLLTEEPFGKISSLRQFRHLPAQLLHLFDQLRLVFTGSAAPRDWPVPQPLRQRLAERGEGDHPGEEPAHRDNRDEDADHAGVQGANRPGSAFLARSRSAKSMRSPRSAISWRACCISASRSSRSACSSSRTPASTARVRTRSAKARTRGKRMITAPATTAMSAMSSLRSTDLSRGREPLGFPLFGHQPFEKVDALTQLAELLGEVAHFFDFVPELFELSQQDVFVFHDDFLARDACRQGLSDRGNREQKQRAATEQENDGD